MSRPRPATTLIGGLFVAALVVGVTLQLAAPAHSAAHDPRAASKATKVLSTHASSLGTIVSGPGGRTTYVYDHDTQGTKHSACTGGCAGVWPAVVFKGTKTTKITHPGVTGKVASIPAGKGKRQVTLNGWPLYYYAGDSAPGDVNGQGSGGIWWTVAPSGAHMNP
jgi:predicted lipoprotein with Yx(FWY)xxD motif